MKSSYKDFTCLLVCKHNEATETVLKLEINMIVLFKNRIEYKFISEILLRLSFINYIVGNFLLISLLFSACQLSFIAGRFLLLSKTVINESFHFYICGLLLENVIVKPVEKFTKAKEVLRSIIKRNMLKNVAQRAKITLSAKQLQIPNYQNQ